MLVDPIPVSKLATCWLISMDEVTQFQYIIFHKIYAPVLDVRCIVILPHQFIIVFVFSGVLHRHENIWVKLTRSKPQ